MMKSFAHAVPKFALGMLLASGVAAGAVAATAQPAQAGVEVSIGIGAPAPAYHWYRWHDYDGWHRQWVRVGWAPPIAYAPVYGYGPGYYGAGYVRPVYVARDPDWYRDARAAQWYRDHHDWDRDRDRRDWH